MKEVLKNARERIKSRCKVCPICNGIACAGDVPGMGGIGTGASFQNNVKALAAKHLNMRVLHDANEPNSEIELWGRKLSMPVMAAPVGTVGPNVGSDMTDKQYIGHLLKGCLEAGTLASIGDIPDITHYESNMSQIKGFGKSVIPFIKPWGLDAVIERMNIAASLGCDIVGTDVDSAGLTILRNLAAPVRVWTVKELTTVIKKAHELKMKYIVKGIMTVDEAILAMDAGADAVLVSNHGGRVLDHTPGTAEVLPKIADAVGKKVIVMLDGGIRSGADILKGVALGAKLTLICRPVAVAIHGDEENGLSKYFAKIKDELSQAMRLTGCAKVSSIDKKVIY